MGEWDEEEIERELRNTAISLTDVLRSEHRFRSSLRHVQTELKAIASGVSTALRAVSDALDDEEGTPRGHFTNLPED
jgi:hypothetical protein